MYTSTCGDGDISIRFQTNNIYFSHLSLLQSPSNVSILQRLVGSTYCKTVAVLPSTTKSLR